MVSDATAIAVPRLQSRGAWSLAESAFVLFLLLIFVGLSPFATRDPAVLAAGENGVGGAGDLTRQIAYSGTFLLIVFAALRTNGARALLCLSPFFAALLAWCLLSAMWAPVPDVALRRGALECVIVLCTMMSVESLGVERSLSLLRAVLAAVVVINWLSIPFIRNAVHLPGEIDPGLVGDWRGLYFHKNIAGSVSALTAILFFFQALKSRPLLNSAICLAAAGFTLMTASKASLGFLPVALAAACLYRVGWRRGIDRAILSVGLLLAAVLVSVIVLKDWPQVTHVLSDPTELTGRTAIWRGEIEFIHDHFLLGAGFGSFADTGAASLLHNYVADTWVQNISHGHNAYLELLVTIGAVGFALAMIVFVFTPARAFWRFDPAQIDIKSIFFAVFVFMALHNFLESDFLEGDDPAWIAFLLMLAMLPRTGVAKPKTKRWPAVAGHDKPWRMTQLRRLDEATL